MTTRPLRFGLQFRSAASATAWSEIARRAESSGFDVLLISDHLSGHWAPLPALAAVAAVTKSIRVGTLVCCNDLRHPLVLAKEAATVDLLSDGRLELGIGAGWSSDDYVPIGLPFDMPAVRVERMQEAVQLIKLAWGGDSFSSDGSHYKISNYTGYPKPAQRPGPPLLIGSSAPKLLAFAAREANIVSFSIGGRRDGGGVSWDNMSCESMSRKVSWVREAAPERFDSLELSCSVVALEATGDRHGAAERLARDFGCDVDILRSSPHVWIGTVAEICSQILEYRERFGITYYTILGQLLDDHRGVFGSVERLAAAEAVVAQLAGM